MKASMHIRLMLVNIEQLTMCLPNNPASAFSQFALDYNLFMS